MQNTNVYAIGWVSGWLGRLPSPCLCDLDLAGSADILGIMGHGTPNM